MSTLHTKGLRPTEACLLLLIHIVRQLSFYFDIFDDVINMYTIKIAYIYQNTKKASVGVFNSIKQGQ